MCGSAAILLGRLFKEKGGKSKWMGALVQLGGCLPYYFISAPKKLTTISSVHPNHPYVSMLAFIYVSIDKILELGSYLYSVGLCYLHVSTYSLLCSSQLALFTRKYNYEVWLNMTIITKKYSSGHGYNYLFMCNSTRL